jgi:hypothetical protein
MSETQPKEPNNFGMTDEVKTEIVKLAKKIESGELGNDPLSQMLTGEVAEALVSLAHELELGQMGNDEMVRILAQILRRLSRGKVKTLQKKKQKQKTVMDIILEQMLRTFAKNNVVRKQGARDVQPGNLAKNMINDLDLAIIRLTSDSRLDSDVNDIQLIEDVIAVNQKIADLSGKVCASTKGMSMRLISAMSVTAGVGGMKGLATLNTLREGVALESWSQANKMNYEHASGQVDAISEHSVESIHSKMKNKLMFKSAEAIQAGPDDVPTTEAAKKLKEKKNLEWELSSTIKHDEGK